MPFPDIFGWEDTGEESDEKKQNHHKPVKCMKKGFFKKCTKCLGLSGFQLHRTTLKTNRFKAFILLELHNFVCHLWPITASLCGPCWNTPANEEKE